MNLREFWVSKLKIPNKKNPFNINIDIKHFVKMKKKKKKKIYFLCLNVINRYKKTDVRKKKKKKTQLMGYASLSKYSRAYRPTQAIAHY